MEKRSEFHRLLRDCRQGLIDRIIVKSVSRFARNTEELLAALRALSEFGVSVYFEEQGIDTAMINSEMLITFPGMAAQQESMPGITGWNKARLMRMIEDKRYLGGDGYPALITAETYEKLQTLKCRKNTQRDTDRTADIFRLELPVLCPSCGHGMLRKHDSRFAVQERWVCQNERCKASVHIADSDLLQGITDTLNTIISQPDIIEEPTAEQKTSDAIHRLNNEIAHILDTYGFQKDSLRKKMMECISLKYAEIDSAQYISKRLKADLISQSPLSAFSADLCKRTVKSIHLGADGTVGLTLINNQKIGKEMTI